MKRAVREFRAQIEKINLPIPSTTLGIWQKDQILHGGHPLLQFGTIWEQHAVEPILELLGNKTKALLKRGRTELVACRKRKVENANAAMVAKAAAEAEEAKAKAAEAGEEADEKESDAAEAEEQEDSDEDLENPDVVDQGLDKTAAVISGDLDPSSVLDDTAPSAAADGAGVAPEINLDFTRRRDDVEDVEDDDIFKICKNR